MTKRRVLKSPRPTKTISEAKAFRADMMPIDPDGKYIMAIDWGAMPPTLRKRTIDNFNASLKAWWESPDPLYTIHTFGQPLTLYRVDEDENEN